MKARACALAGLFVCLLGRASSGAEDPVERLAAAIATRLVWVEEVARFKWNAKLPAIDEARERALLARSLDAAEAIGLDADFARRIVEAQLAASRTLQSAAFEDWARSAQPPFPHPHDLATVTRPELDLATHALLVAAKEAQPALESCQQRTRLVRPDRVPPDVWTLAIGEFVAGPCR